MNLYFKFILVGVLALGAISFIAVRGLNHAVERAVVREAVDKAENWGDFMASRVPDLDTLVATGIPTDQQQRIIREIRNVGDIFRFKLFTADGRLSLVSDDANISGPGGLSDLVDPEPSQVARTGKPIVEVYDGSQKPDRPDIYAEAYIPLLSSDGTVKGVVEVYVDQTSTRSYFVDSFKNFGVMLTTFCALLFAIPAGAFLLQRIVSDRSRKAAEFLAHFDPLTGLLNRREFVEQSERLLEQGGLSVVCYIDLDRFKTVNDTYGHAVGDAVLVHTSQVLRKNCRSDDLLARFGGDEFVISFSDIDLEAAALRVRAILRDFSAQTDILNVKLNGSLSAGLAVVEKGETLERVLSNADAALYHVKSAGRNDFAVYGAEMGEELRERHALEKRLREATQTSDFKIHYQPLVDGKSCEVIGYEALLRLSHVDGTPISPCVFIPLAEELGLIDEIGTWVMRTSMRDMMDMHEETTLAVNLSSNQFQSGELVNIVRNAVQETGFPTERLELEITESLLLEDSPLIEMQIDTLREMGVAIAMDDFGTGFSSLSYLWKYGFDRLKIDRSFVAALDENPERSREIIETVVMLGARLGMKITAEGVETHEQSQLLSTLGCDVLQGYLHGRPEPLSTLQKHGSEIVEGTAKAG